MEKQSDSSYSELRKAFFKHSELRKGLLMIANSLFFLSGCFLIFSDPKSVLFAAGQRFFFAALVPQLAYSVTGWFQNQREKDRAN